MSNQHCPEVALSRVQRVWWTFADLSETKLNKVTFPLATDLIKPSGDVVVNQTTPTQDSLEKSNTLDVTNVHQGIADVASATVPMYVFMDDYTKPIEGDKLLVAAMGKFVASGTIKGEVATAVAIGDTSIVIDGVTGKLPLRGVIEIANDDRSKVERIHYESYTQDTVDNTKYTLNDCTRGYGDALSIDAFDVADDVTVLSRIYRQDICRQDGCLWVQTDTLLKAVVGARVTECSIPVDVNGAVMLSFTINGKRMYSAGTSDLKADALVGATKIKVTDARAFFVGQRIRNESAINEDDNAGQGYTVTAISEELNELTLQTGLLKAWATDDPITWWMYEDKYKHINEEVMNRDTTIKMNGERALLRSGSITAGTGVTPIQLVGDRYPGIMVDGIRNITASVSQLMMKDAAIRIREGFEGKEVRLDFEFGYIIGNKISYVMPRAKLATASESFQDPVVYLDSTARALGTVGEDSVEIILE